MLRGLRSRLKATLTWRRLLLIYVILLAAHHLVVAVWNPSVTFDDQPDVPTGSARFTVEVPAFLDDGSSTSTAEITGYVWPGSGLVDGAVVDGGSPPILILHGSPSGGGVELARLADLLAAQGRTVIAIDRPGFARSSPWFPSYSVRANGHIAWAVLDEIGVDRAHLVGWSQGGGAVIYMADEHPQRTASMTLMAAIGVQEGEGSGDYYFEHGKYAVGYGLAVVLPELIPHFNVLGDRATRHAFIRDFWDTDQRPIRGILEELDTPTLVLHGRHDPLIPAWTAQEHHRIIKDSRLVMLDASHFFPFGEPMEPQENTDDAAIVLGQFFDRHNEPNAPRLPGAVDFAPTEEKETFSIPGFTFDRDTPWWTIVLLLALATLISEDLTVVFAGLLMVAGNLDFGVALLGCFTGILIGDYGLWAIGRFGGRRALNLPIINKAIKPGTIEHWSKVFERHTVKAIFLSRMLPGTRIPMYITAGMIGKNSAKFILWFAVAVFLWTPLLLLLTVLIGPSILGFFKEVFHGPWAYIAAFIALALLIRIASLEASELGRQRLKADVQRLYRAEFWPRSVFYLPLIPWLAWLSLRSRGPLAFSCVNPGIPHGGGIVGEDKTRILTGFDLSTAPVLFPLAIPGKKDAGEAAERLAILTRAQEAHPQLGYPLMLKPESGERGRGVRRVNNAEEALAYLERHPEDVHAQAYHPGPYELGIFWSRDPRSSLPMDERPGFVFSITRKQFPTIIGDGERTLEELIWHHPRYRMQAKAYCNAQNHQLDRVLDDGEELTLTFTGNHASGCIFSDGADLITPELTAWVEQAAQSYQDPESGGRIDFGRFDIRAVSKEDLNSGRVGIIEFNGTLAESTNLYDPDRNILFMYRTLFAQWSLLYKIGRARRREGAKGIGYRKLISMVMGHRVKD